MAEPHRLEEAHRPEGARQLQRHSPPSKVPAAPLRRRPYGTACAWLSPAFRMKCTEILILKIRLALPIIAPDEGKSFAVAELQQARISLVSVGPSRLKPQRRGCSMK